MEKYEEVIQLYSNTLIYVSILGEGRREYIENTTGERERVWMNEIVGERGIVYCGRDKVNKDQ